MSSEARLTKNATDRIKKERNWRRFGQVLSKLHGGTGTTDPDAQYILHSLATAENDFLVASGISVFVKRTLAQVKALLGLGASGDYVPHSLATAKSDFLVGVTDGGAFEKATLLEAKALIGGGGGGEPGGGGIKTGSYTGNGTNPHAITGVGFAPEFLTVWERDGGDSPQYKTLQDGLYTKGGGGGYSLNKIISLDADGFTLGSHGAVNQNGKIYSYVASIYGGGGEVTSPDPVVDDDIAVFNGTTGKLVKDSSVLIGNVPTMAAVGGAGNLLKTAAADKAVSDSGIPVANVPIMAAAGGAGEFLYTAAADKAVAKSGKTAASFVEHSIAAAKGDILAASGAGVFAKLTVGTNAWSLVADSSTATGLKWADVSAAGVTDHGALTGLGDDDHTQYLLHALATAASDFLVASGAGAFVKKTLAETKTVLDVSPASWNPPPIIKSADESVASSTVLQNDDSLYFRAADGETWTFEFILFNTTGSPGLKTNIVPALSGSANATLAYFTEMKNKADSSSGEDGYSAEVSHTWGTTGVGYTRIFGTAVRSGAGDCIIHIRWAQASSNATATTVYAGSYVIARRIA